MSYTVTSSSIQDQIKNNGYAVITLKVDGYWSRDQITVHISRDWNFDTKDSRWNIDESHSSGGVDSNVDISSAERARNFAHAMLYAAEQIDFYTKHNYWLDSWYSEYKDMIKAREVEAEKQRMIGNALKAEAARKDREKHPSMSKEEAVKIAESLKERVSGDETLASESIIHRHESARSEFPVSAHAENYNGKTRYYISGRPYSKKKFIELLSTEFCPA